MANKKAAKKKATGKKPPVKTSSKKPATGEIKQAWEDGGAVTCAPDTSGN